MKKNFKRTLAKVMAVALTVSMLGVSANDADAAKKIKLSSKSISVVKGKTKKVTIKNVKAKKVKKLTVKSANKKIATVKKAGKTAIKVTGKKAGKSTKVTVKVKVGKKTTKLTLKVKVTKAKAPAKTAAPTAAPASATPAASAAASATPAASAAASATPAASAAASATPDTTPETTPVATAPVQPDEPTTPAKELPEVNLRRDNVPAWVTKGGYCTALFNTDDTVSYSSKAWSDKSSCYNNGIAWYIDSAKKGKIDMSEYSEVALTIKTDAEVKFMTWSGSNDPESFWDKNDTWGNVKETIQNEDGSKTLVYDLETVFGSATKVKKAISVGFTLKSDLNGDDQAFSERTATVYSIKFIKGSSQGGNETGSTETGSTETGSTESGSTESGSTESGSTETGNVETSNVETSDVVINKVYSAKVGGTQWKNAGIIDLTNDLPENFDITKYASVKVVGYLEDASGKEISDWGNAQVALCSDKNDWGHSGFTSVFQNFAANTEKKTAEVTINKGTKDLSTIYVYAQNASNKLTDGFTFKVTSVTFVAK